MTEPGKVSQVSRGKRLHFQAINSPIVYWQFEYRVREDFLRLGVSFCALLAAESFLTSAARSRADTTHFDEDRWVTVWKGIKNEAGDLHVRSVIAALRV